MRRRLRLTPDPAVLAFDRRQRGMFHAKSFEEYAATVINLTTAKALSLTVPPSVVQRHKRPPGRNRSFRRGK